MSIQASMKSAVPSPATDYDAIATVIQLYIDGLNEADADKLRACFHENAWAAWTNEDGSLVQHPVQELLDDWTSESMPKRWTHRIQSVTQAGDVASVLLEMHTADLRAARAGHVVEGWVDIHALLRIDGVWKDMNKTATHVSRAGWANTAGGRSRPSASTETSGTQAGPRRRGQAVSYD